MAMAQGMLLYRGLALAAVGTIKMEPVVLRRAPRPEMAAASNSGALNIKYDH